MIKFGEWLPDIAPYDHPGATEALNVVPTIEGYRQFNQFSRITQALTGECIGAFAAQAKDRASYNYAGDSSKLYQLADDTWTDQSKGGGYSVSSQDVWEFVKFGEKIIAVGGINSGTPVTPQVITMGAVGGTQFADLGGSPPQARHIATVKDFVVLGNLYESSTEFPSRIRWSGVNDETTWTTNKAKQSDYQDIPGKGGWIQKVVGGDFGIVIMERGIVRMDYIGPPLVFSFNRVLPELGTNAPNSVVQWGDFVFLLGPTGFNGIANGVERLDIGDNKINRWFFSRVDSNYLYRVVGALDRVNNRIVWIFPDNTSSEGLPNNGLIFDIATKRWARFEDNLQWVYESYGISYTLDGLDNVSTSIDNLGASLDDPIWVNAIIGLGAFDDQNFAGRFTGDPATAVMETKEQKLSGGRRTMINRIRPEVDTTAGSGDDTETTVTIEVGERDSQEDSVIWGGALTQERDGNYSLRSDSRYHRFRVTVTGEFSRAHGMAVVEGTPSSTY